MTQVVFHIGDRKTGSTSIQSTLAAGAVLCDPVRLLYPRQTALTHNVLAQSFTDKSAPAGRRDTMFSSVVGEITRQAPDVAIISAEHFESVEPAALMEAITTHMPQYLDATRVIAYVRPHADRLVSEFAEQVKQGVYFGTMEELHARIVKRERFHFAPRFAKWRDVFGTRFELRPMIRDKLYKQDVVADFLQYVLGDTPFEIREMQKFNESLSLHDLAILRELQKQLRPANGRAGPLQGTTGWAMARRMNSIAGSQNTRLRLHRSLAEELAETYRDDAASLDATYFTGTPMSEALAAAPGKAIENAQSVEAKDLFDADTFRMVQLWTGQVAELLLATPDVWPRYFRSTHRANVTKGEADATDAGIPAKKRKAGAKAGKTGARKTGVAKGRADGADDLAKPGRRAGKGPKARGKKAQRSVEAAAQDDGSA